MNPEQRLAVTAVVFALLSIAAAVDGADVWRWAFGVLAGAALAFMSLEARDRRRAVEKPASQQTSS